MTDQINLSSVSGSSTASGTVRTGGRAKAWLALSGLALAVALLLVWAIFWRSSGQNWNLLGELSEDTWGCGVIADPGFMFESSERMLDDLPVEIAEGFREFRRELLDEIGLDVFSADALQDAGLNPNAPIIVNVPKIGAAAEPEAVVFSLGLANRRRALDTMAGIARRQGMDWRRVEREEFEIHSLDDEAFAAFLDDRVHFALGDSQRACLAALRRTIEPSGRRLKDNPDFARLTKSMGRGNLAVYIPLRPIFSSILDGLGRYDEEEEMVVRWLSDNFSALGLTAARKHYDIMALLATDSTLGERLRPAGDSRDFMRRLDQPVMAASFSVDGPAELLFHIAGEMGGRAATGRLENMLMDEFELRRSDLETMFPSLAGGMAVCGFDRYGDPEFMLFVELGERGEAEVDRFIRRENHRAKVERHGDNILYRDSYDDDFAAGIIDGHLVVGNAVSQIARLARGDEGGDWRPRTGAGLLMSMEYDPGKLLAEMGKHMPAEEFAVVEALFGESRSEKPVCSELTSSRDGLIIRTEGAEMMNLNAGVLGGVLLPALNQARARARQVGDMSHLRQIVIALMMYADDHGGALPENLGQLLEYLPGEVLISPASNTEPPQSERDVLQGQCDYIYFGKGIKLYQLASPNDHPVAVTRPGIFRGGYVNVLFADGRVQGYERPPPEIRELIEEYR